jgi:hypothetical protein
MGKQQETYLYYGPLNWVMFNMGFIMNIMTFPWSCGADCRSFTAWLLNFTGPYLPTSPIRDSCSNLSLTKKSAHLVVGFALIHGNHRYPRPKKGESREQAAQVGGGRIIKIVQKVQIVPGTLRRYGKLEETL